MSVTIDLAGTVVLVTGAARGVGRGIAERFLAAGAKVEYCGRSRPGSDPSADGRSARFTAVDVRDAEAVAAWVAEVGERHGRIDTVINNVGGSPFTRYEDGSVRYIRAILDLNFTSAAIVSTAAYPFLRKTRGSIVNITSISARRPSPGTAVYGAAKGPLESLTRTLGAEWAPSVRVNAVSSGLVDTDSGEDHYGDEGQHAAIAYTIPRGQFAAPHEVGAACLMLASPLASHITGAVLAVDGGGEWPSFLSHTPNADALRPDLVAP